MKTTNMYGVELTEIQAMKFCKYLDNNPKLPAPNTINKEERKQLVLDWMKDTQQIPPEWANEAGEDYANGEEYLM